jgi:hypothetical protein
MISTLVLFSLFFDDSGDKGRDCFAALIDQSDDALVTVFADMGQESLHKKPEGKSLSSFNLLESVLNRQSRNEGVVHCRYRPAVSGGIWKRIETPDPSRVMSKTGLNTFELFLTFLQLQNTKAFSSAAVFQVMCSFTGPVTGSTLAEHLMLYVPDLVTLGMWGYANEIPFRDLSADEEWVVARTETLWRDLSVTVHGNHKYLFKTDTVTPKVPIPETGTRVGPITFYLL